MGYDAGQCQVILGLIWTWVVVHSGPEYETMLTRISFSLIIESDDENYEIDDAPFSIIRLFPKLHVLMFIRFVVRQMH